jgi:hypothetical protein
MGAFTEFLPTTIVGVLAPLVTVCLPLLSRVRAKKVRRETSWLNLVDSGMFHIPAADGG